MSTRVLVIDDSASFRDQVTEAFRQSALFDDYRTAANGLEGFKSLTEKPADLVVCDVVMPQLDGLKFLQLVHNQPQFKDIPIIILTGNHDREVKLKGLEEGASDFLTKPFDMAELVARVKIHLKIKMLQDDLKAARSHFEQLSNTDPLTNLYNRRFFAEILEAELQRAKRLNSELTLLVVDIDHFKTINDRFGHQAGDQVLAAVTDTLRGALRSYDVAARYGGEEFAIILPGTHYRAGIEVAERLREAVGSLPFAAPLQGLRVTVSVGAASLSGDRLDNSESLLKRADEALFLAKHNGRNRVEGLAGEHVPGLVAVH